MLELPTVDVPSMATMYGGPATEASMRSAAYEASVAIEDVLRRDSRIHMFGDLLEPDGSTVFEVRTYPGWGESVRRMLAGRTIRGLPVVVREGPPAIPQTGVSGLVAGPYSQRLSGGEIVTCWLTSGGWICDRPPFAPPPQPMPWRSRSHWSPQAHGHSRTHGLGAINVGAGLETLALIGLLVGGVVLARRVTAHRQPRRRRARRHNARRAAIVFDMLRGHKPSEATRALLQEYLPGSMGYERGERFSASLYDRHGVYVGGLDSKHSTVRGLVTDLQARGIVVA